MTAGSGALEAQMAVIAGGTGVARVFDLGPDVTDPVMGLNCLGTATTGQAFGRNMAECGQGVIVTAASMTSCHPMTRVLTSADTGESSERTDAILRDMPTGRDRRPEDLDTALHFHVDPASAFVTAIVVPGDAGVLSFSGV